MPDCRKGFVSNRAVTDWAAIVGRQIEKSIESNYGAAWQHFGPMLRADLIDAQILGVMLNVERFSQGDLSDGEFEGRVKAIRNFITPRINKLNA
jgi:hypothetical protein